ncbi:retron Ec67 family RNA-directed DNA polymerase/endonuclease [Campylobacter mucosalis]|uniref:retron Ec67 family RNA-directed DNA polymerase/endonuclease n=1 Tax=Campylobacter mucosalis TaxID=202 RepID=UPI0014702C6F|nr:retron Ec67 family RNA-directed DNA polymerase/endonuclease [Campylobacter mucosalis]
MENFNDLKTIKEFAKFIDTPLQKITYIIHRQKIENLYNSFEIPKKNGGIRTIDAPHDDLKQIQIKIKNMLWKHQKKIWEKYNQNKIPNISHGFESGKTFITNATVHKNKRFVLNIDLLDFFYFFHFGRVKGFFEKNKYFKVPSEIAITIARLACYQQRLPQGSPCSPIITNLICNILDIRLLKLGKKYKLDYTRYADDLTFSTNNKIFPKHYDEFLFEITSVIEKAGFKINDKKTRLLYKNSKQEVTGLVVNKKLNVSNDYYKTTRAMANTLYKDGSFTINGADGTINQLEGRFAFIDRLSKHNNKLDTNKHDFWHLSGREKEYQKFLFFKYFLQNTKPLIITEGKTDIVYIKSALKNLYKNYPRLIIKEGNNFKFHISFLNKTKRLSYFLNINIDGGSVMSNIYKNMYNNENSLAKLFKDKYKTEAKNNVILLVDNEQKNENKPLRQLLNSAKINLNQNISSHITHNLYLLTHQLVDNKKECEIENLFTNETLGTKLNNKSLNLKEKDFNKEIHYGKEIFSQYVRKNYKHIDFSNFKPLLDELNNLL